MNKPKKKHQPKAQINSSLNIFPQKFNWHDIKSTKWLPALLTLTLLIILFSLRLINNLDIGFNLKGGEWVINNLAFHTKDVFTYTVNGNDYINLHWLYQVILFLTYKFLSYEGITFLNVIIILILFYLVFKRLNLLQIPLPLNIFLMFTLLIIIQIRFSYRPELITWVGIALLLLLLDNYFYSGKKYLKFAPLIILFWVNMHGLFIIGLFILTAYFISLYKREKKIDRYYLKWFLLSILASLVNPYFIKGTLFPIYLSTRLEPSNIFKQTISELKSPWEFTGNFQFEIYLFSIIGIIAVILILLTYKKRYVHEFIILAAFGYISFQSFRNIPIFLIYAIAIAGVSIIGLYNEHKEKLAAIADKLRSKFAVYGLCVIMLLISVRVVTNAYYSSYGTGIDFGIGLNESSFPVKAAEYMNQNRLDGKIINYFSFGSWFIWQLPQPVFIDGRLEVIQEDFYTEYFNSFSAGGLNKLIVKYNPVIIAFEHYQGYEWTQQLKNMPEWRLIYWDALAAVYIKNTYMPTIPSAGFQQNEIAGKYNINYPGDIPALLNSGKLHDFNFWLRGFYRKFYNHQDLLKIALFALDNSYNGLAKDCYLTYLQISDGYLIKDNYKDLYSNLGSIYYNEKDYQKAKICFLKYLEIDPGNAGIVKLLNSIKQ